MGLSGEREVAWVEMGRKRRGPLVCIPPARRSALSTSLGPSPRASRRAGPPRARAAGLRRGRNVLGRIETARGGCAHPRRRLARPAGHDAPRGRSGAARGGSVLGQGMGGGRARPAGPAPHRRALPEPRAPGASRGGHGRGTRRRGRGRRTPTGPGAGSVRAARERVPCAMEVECSLLRRRLFDGARGVQRRLRWRDRAARHGPARNRHEGSGPRRGGGHGHGPYGFAPAARGSMRAHTSSTNVVRRIAAGACEHESRPCIGADRVDTGGAATGREPSSPHVVAPVARRRRVVDVGAGPGLEGHVGGGGAAPRRDSPKGRPEPSGLLRARPTTRAGGGFWASRPGA